MSYSVKIVAALNEDAWFYKGLMLKKLNRYEDAIASYEKALDINPLYESAWRSRGIALKYLKRYEDAIFSYDKAIEINPLNKCIWHNRGYALWYLNRYEDAIVSFNQALQGKIHLAVENLKQAINLNPKFCKTASTDSDFEQIRLDERFKRLIGKQLN
ncbi:MAG: tetratricopeptide repeat protein [Rivularia sp. (in: Bacteria)]|nr:tetratricopeptide repeat protein [Rivularia sp. MS3]